MLRRCSSSINGGVCVHSAKLWCGDRGASAFVATAVFPHRHFFQGGPPPNQPASKSKAQEYLQSKSNEMDERLEERRQDHERYYTKGGGDSKPVPLFENAFKPGEFGMRRRLVVLHRKEKKRTWDAKERGMAVADAQASFFK